MQGLTRALIVVTGAVAVLIAVLWLGGGLDWVAAAAVEGQRAFQNALAGALRRLRAGDAWAVWSLLGLAFGYGVCHAAGPGHGKVLIGGYGVARAVAARRLATIAAAAGLAQATAAVALVSAGVLVLGLGREAMVGLAESVLAPVSDIAIAGVGFWLVLRGMRRLAQRHHVQGPHLQGPHVQGPHVHGPHCAHGPEPGAAARAGTLREAALLIGSVAIRPCTGAIFLLILTWRMGIFAAGIAGTYAMGLGTASVTVAAALLAVSARRGAGIATGRGAARLMRALPVVETAAGAVIAIVALRLFAGAV